jgi:membrane protease YdiL (CAAX protease family)
MEAGSPTDAGYPGAAVAGAVLATLFFPLIALIAALLLQGDQLDLRKKSQLRTWAWASFGWMVFGVVLVVLAVGAFHGSGSSASRSGPCQGGPVMNSTGQNIPGTDKYVFPCVFGGTETTRLPNP